MLFVNAMWVDPWNGCARTWIVAYARTVNARCDAGAWLDLVRQRDFGGSFEGFGVCDKWTRTPNLYSN